MKLPRSHKPSLVILGRTTFALIVIGVAAFSLAVGYLVGYQVTPLSSGEQPVLGKQDARIVVPPDEKRVLEPTPPVAVPQPQQAVQAERQPAPSVSVNSLASESAAAKDGQRAQLQEKNPAATEPGKPDMKVAANAPAAPDQKNTAEAIRASEPQKAIAPGASKKAAPANGAYVVDFGAFADASRADALKSELSKKGVKAYIVSKDKNTRYTRVRAGGFATYAEAAKYASAAEAKTGVAGFVAKR